MDEFLLIIEKVTKYISDLHRNGNWSGVYTRASGIAKAFVCPMHHTAWVGFWIYRFRYELDFWIYVRYTVPRICNNSI